MAIPKKSIEKRNNQLTPRVVEESIGYCGVDCSKCSDFAEGKCPGCRQSTWPEGDACPPVACCTEKGITCCGECAEFPCQMMAEFYEESDSHREAYQRMLALRGK